MILPFQIVPCTFIVGSFPDLAETVPFTKRTASQICGAESLMHVHILKREQWQHYTMETEEIQSKDREHSFIRKVWHRSNPSCMSTSRSEKKHSLNLSLHYSWIREARGVRNHKMPLVPGRVIPHVFFQEGLHELQLVVPQFVFLRIHEGKIWQRFPLCHYAALLATAPATAPATREPNTDRRAHQASS